MTKIKHNKSMNTSEQGYANTAKIQVLEKELFIMNEQNREDHKDMKECLDTVNRKLDNIGDRFAGKWVERAFIATGMALFSAVLGLIFLIIEGHIRFN